MWILSIDNASNRKGNGVRIVLRGLYDLLLEQYLNFEFKDNNNQAKYEALIFGMILTLEMDVMCLKTRKDS